jgi:hypothetical protein
MYFFIFFILVITNIYYIYCNDIISFNVHDKVNEIIQQSSSIDIAINKLTQLRSDITTKDINLYKNLFDINTKAISHTKKPIVLSQKRNFIRRVSAVINDQHNMIMCTIPKIGSSSWRKFMLYLEFPYLSLPNGQELYEKKFGVSMPNQHNMTKNGLKLMATQSPDISIAYYNNPHYIKLFHARNPITRVLSAWLSKNANSSNPMEFAMHHSTFESFVKVHTVCMCAYNLLYIDTNYIIFINITFITYSHLTHH